MFMCNLFNRAGGDFEVSSRVYGQQHQNIELDEIKKQNHK